MEDRVATIVVTYNRKELLIECIDTLLKQSYKNMDIYVIDNGSREDTRKALVPWIKEGKINYTNTGRNLGGAGGFNYGIKLVASKPYDYIWLMDDDTVPKEDALECLMAAKSIVNDKFGFLASSVLYSDGDFCCMNMPGVKRTAFYNKHYKVINKGLLKIEYASFVSILVPTKVVLEVGLPIKDFFIWKDDYEYTTRISKEYNCYYVANSIVEHKIKNNMMPDIASDEENRIDRYFYEYRNGYYMIRHEGLKAHLQYYYEIFGAVGKILKISHSFRWRRIRVVLKGMICGWFFNPLIEYIG